MKIFLTIIIIALLVVGALIWLRPSPNAPQAGQADAAVRATVTAFGSQLQKVSVLSPTAANDMDAAYGPYVDAQLLAQWKTDPSTAPGRQTSSPWPDHIAIDDVRSTGTDTYSVSGSVVLMTSNEVEHGGMAGSIPVDIMLRNEDGSWKIAAYDEGAPVSGTPASS